MSGLISQVVSPAPRSEWQKVTKIDPTSTLTQGPEWMDALCSFTSWRDASRYYETSDGNSIVVPLAEKGITTAGRVLASMPGGWGMGGMVSSLPVRHEDVMAVLEDLISLRCLRLRILPNPLRGVEWSASVSAPTIALPRRSHVVDLEGGFEVVQGQLFGKTARKKVRRALRENLEVERDTTGRLIPVYRDLFERSIVRWAERSNEPLWLARKRGNREDPAGKLEFLAETLGDQMVTWVAWRSGEPAAAAIDLKGNSTFGWRGAMHEEHGPATYAPYLLQDFAMREACTDGNRYYYLGESGQSEGMATFKENFGGIGFTYPEIRFERLPITRTDQAARTAVKRLVGYRSG
jgi:hypothetical protein